MATLYMLIGIPGSGKSTYSKNNKLFSNCTIINPDALRKEYFGSESIQARNQDIFAEAHKRVLTALYSGQDVVFDATNIRRHDRETLISRLPDGTKTIALYFNTPLYECLRRNAARARYVPDKVIHRMYHALEKPTCDEFDKIIYCK